MNTKERNIEYLNRMKTARKEASRITLAQERELNEIYKRSIKSLSKKAGEASAGSLDQKFKKEYLKELKAEQRRLEGRIEELVKTGVRETTLITTQAQRAFMESVGIDKLTTPKSFNSMFGQIQDQTVRTMLRGDLYADGKTLSNRVWDIGQDFNKDIQYTIAQALIEKQSAPELAKNLEQFLTPPTKRQQEWRDQHPKLASKQIDYRATRLARTSMHHTYQAGTIAAANVNPFVEGILWMSANISGRTCDLCRSRDGTVYKTNQVPLDHPNGLCTMIPEILKTTEEVTAEIKDWANGGDNPKLDAWSKKMNTPGADMGKVAPIDTTKAKAEKQKRSKANTPAAKAQTTGGPTDKIKTQVQKAKEGRAERQKKDDLLESIRIASDKAKAHSIGAKPLQRADLEDIVNNIYNKFTRERKIQIESYIGSSRSFEINQALRYKRPQSQKNLKIVNELKRTIKETQIPYKTIVKRRVDSRFLENLSDQLRLNLDLFNLSVDDGRPLMMGGENAKHMAEASKKLNGVVFKEKGFMSTSWDGKKNVFQDRNIELEIVVPKGKNGLITPNWSESEIIFAPGTELEIVEMVRELVTDRFGNNTAKVVIKAIMKP